jgi:hypothetical protein
MIGVAGYQFVAMSAKKTHASSGGKTCANKMLVTVASVGFFKRSGLTKSSLLR